MPPKAEYWRYFNVVGVVAYCLIAECKQPNVSLGALPKPDDSRHLAKKARILPFSGEPNLFIINSSMLVFSDHFWGVISDFVLFSSSKNSFCDINKNTPKSHGMGLIALCEEMLQF